MPFWLMVMTASLPSSSASLRGYGLTHSGGPRGEGARTAQGAR